MNRIYLLPIFIISGLLFLFSYSTVAAQCSGVCVVTDWCYKVGRRVASGTCPAATQKCCNRFTSLCEAANNCPGSAGMDEYDLCYACMCEQGGTWTDLGCINTRSVNGIIISVVRIIFGVIGGIALILMISVGYLYQTGNTENIEKAKKRVIALFSAIIFLVFSVLLLRIIGVNILDVTTPGILN